MLVSEPIQQEAGQRGQGVWRAAFWALLAFQCALFWAFPFFPSQDGPSHLHNALVMADSGRKPGYRAYYEPAPFSLAGNLTAQYALETLVRMVPPRVAEKLLLTGFAALFFLSFRYLAAACGAGPPFATWAALFAPSWFLFMGFWNFVFAGALALAALGFYLRRAGRWSARALAGWFALGALLYATHVAAWAACGLVVAALGLERLAAGWRADRGRALRDFALPLALWLPPGLALAIFLQGSHPASVCGVVSGWQERLWPLYSLSFLHVTGRADVLLARAAGAAFALGTLAAVWRRRLPAPGLLAASALLAAVAALGPDCVGEGTFLQSRMAWFAWMLLAVWIASAASRWPATRAQALAASIAALGALAILAKWPAVSEWNRGLRELTTLTAAIPPNATVLPLSLERSKDRVDPYLHPVGLAAPTPLIDLANYEAATPFFTTRFRPERSPFPALGTLRELVAEPPVFDLPRYEAQTQGHVDYLLFRDSGARGAAAERERYAAPLAAFRLRIQSPSARFRLWERKR